MVEGNTQQSDEPAADTDKAADLSDVQASWSRAWEAQKDQFSKAKSLVSAEMALCAKAIVLSVLCGLLLIGIVLIIWSTLLVTMSYAAHLAGLHWAAISTLVIFLNVMLFWLVKRILENAKQSINLRTTFNTIFKADASDSSASAE